MPCGFALMGVSLCVALGSHGQRFSESCDGQHGRQPCGAHKDASLLQLSSSKYNLAAQGSASIQQFLDYPVGKDFEVALAQLASDVASGQKNISNVEHMTLRAIDEQMRAFSNDVIEELKVLQANIDTVRDDILRCNDSLGDLDSYASDTASREESHSLCRVNQSNINASKQKTCKEHFDLASSVHPPACLSSLPSSAAPDQFAHVMDCIQDVIPWSSSYNESVSSKKRACESATDALNLHKQKCDLAQRDYESSFCQDHQKVIGGCVSYDGCRANGISKRAREHESVGNLEASLKAQYMAAKKIMCFITVFDDTSNQEDVLQVCHHLTVNTSALDIAYHAEPAAEMCDTKRVAMKPCHARYQNKSWFEGAPATTCLECLHLVTQDSTPQPTSTPTASSTQTPTSASPTQEPTPQPTQHPTQHPTLEPTPEPTQAPTAPTTATPGAVKCWGHDDHSVVSKAPTFTDFISISAGRQHCCGVRSNHEIVCWGWKGTMKAPDYTDFVSVSSSYYTSCGLRSNGAIVCWGLNNHGGVSLAPTDTDFIDVSVGGWNSCALRSNHTIVCWGTMNYAGVISKVPTEADFVKVKCIQNHICAIRFDQTITCWGWDADGRLDVPAHADFIDVAGFSHLTCGLRSNGAIECWSSLNYDGEVNPPTFTDFVSVGAGHHSGCGLRSNGAIECWGQRYQQIPADTDFYAMTVGENRWMCGLRAVRA